MKAREIRRQDQELHFYWEDQTHTQIPIGWMRGQCSCAVCSEKGQEDFPLFESRSALEKAYQIKSLSPVGNYGIEVLWGDGHRSIYSLERLVGAFKNLSLPPHLRSLQKENLG